LILTGQQLGVLKVSAIEPELVNPGHQGHGFKPVKKPINARLGDSVMVGPGGAATVTYYDGCKVNVEPGAVTTIARLSPCASGSNAQNFPWECHPDQTHDCGWTTGTTAFWALWLGGVGFTRRQSSAALLVSFRAGSGRH
jgi:hypothetical protein